MITIIEGARNTGKTYLLKNLEDYTNPIHYNNYKFAYDWWNEKLGDVYNSSYGDYTWKESEEHILGLSKELMVMDLNKKGLLNKNIMMDRGFLTVFVWSVLMERISLVVALKQLNLMNDIGLLENLRILYIETSRDNPYNRGIKDKWDYVDKGKESYYYELIIKHLETLGVKVNRFINNFNKEDVSKFKELCAEF